MTQPIRGSELFIGADILRTMRAIAATHEITRQVSGGSGEYANGYSAGFIDGLRTMAESMGLNFQPGMGNSSIGVRWDG